MHRRWGTDLARCISRRLQQLEAMGSLDDLAFMPFDFAEHADGVLEVALDDEMSLFMRELTPAQEDGRLQATHVMISGVGAQTMTAAR